jgi:NitT/TauT family transport system substrate-binding protein
MPGMIPTRNCGGKEMKRSTRVSWFLALLALTQACELQSDKRALDDVTVQLKWVHQAQFAGLYVAREKGHYAREGIRIHFLEGGASIDNVEAVTSGRAQFAVTTPEDVLISRSRGVPLQAIAAIYRRSAVVFLAPAASHITRPQDFLGKTVAAGNTGGANRDLEFQLVALMKKLGLDLSKIGVVPYDPKYTAFIDGTVDVTAAFSTGGLISLRQKGLKLNLIWPSDYGIHFYSDSLVTTDETTREKPDLVLRFLRATLKGWQEAVGNSQEAVAITLEYAHVKDPQFQTAMMESLLPLVHTGEDRIGWMKPAVWEGMYEVLLEQRILNGPFDVSQAYTLSFLDEIYRGVKK